MGTLFQDASVVFIAAAAEDINTGLLHERTVHQWHTIHSAKEADTQITLQVRQPTRHTHFPEQTPILRRGWRYQEKLLAQRCISFTSHEVIWDCRHKRECECHTAVQNPIHSQLLPFFFDRMPGS